MIKQNCRNKEQNCRESEREKEKEREIQRNRDRVSVCLLVENRLVERHFVDRAQNQIHQLLCQRIHSSSADSCSGPLPVDQMPWLQDSRPKASSPKVSRPKVGWPKVSRPKVSRPKVSWPKVSEPNVSRPKVSRPKVSWPKVSR